MNAPSSFAACQRTDPSGRVRWCHYVHPEATLETRRLDEVLPRLREAEAARDRGLHAVGWIAYEAAPAFDPRLPASPPDPHLPLLRFTLYREERPGLPRRHAPPAAATPFVPSLDEATFRKKVNAVHRAIAAGETYQVNLTYPGHFTLSGSPWDWFRTLRLSQAASHQAYLEEPDRVLVSASPELFFRHRDHRILCRPMKGTARPDATRALRASAKDQAENVMIVDMIRNDLGKHAPPGKVHTERLFDIERYPSLAQMTSTVSAEGPGSAVDWLRVLFPCASITGAPKRRTMEWIRRLESGPRGIYTGCIGGFFADGTAEFNVAIRTAVIQRDTGKARYHTGCGIVWDSDPADEYAESLLKTAVLSHPPSPFQLIETMRGEPGRGILHREDHLARLRASAAELGFEWDEAALGTALDAAAARVTSPAKLRLLLSVDGTHHLSASPLPEASSRPQTFRIDPAPTPADHPELRHKTTRRDIYAQARERCPDVEETLLINPRGELMEFTIGNLVLEREGERITPPRSSGLLPGTFRQRLLREDGVRERVCRKEDLHTADHIYRANAVRGLVPMRWRERQ